MNFNDLITDLQGNPNLIASYISNPTDVLDSYNLTSEEYDALLAGSFDELVDLGVSSDLAAGVLSGAHSSTCMTTIAHE